MYRLPRITIEAKPEHLALAASFAQRILADGRPAAELRVEGEGPAFLLVAKRNRAGISIVGRDP